MVQYRKHAAFIVVHITFNIIDALDNNKVLPSRPNLKSAEKNVLS